MLDEWLGNELVSRGWRSAEMTCEVTVDILLHLYLHDQA
jgi:hypothetical protein